MRAALQFLTVLPVGGSDPPARAAVFFPLVGALLGLGGGAIRTYAPLPAGVSAALALVFLVAITGALHEDGLADVADAFRAGRAPERILSILKDSRIGVYGAVALVLALLLRWQAMELLALPAMVAAGGASRGAMVVLAAVSEPLGDGLGKAFCVGLRTPDVVIAGIEAAGLPFLGGYLVGMTALAVNGMMVWFGYLYFHKRAGGITGDCLGAICQITEITTLLAFLCRFS